jgi:hypothetical protein
MLEMPSSFRGHPASMALALPLLFALGAVNRWPWVSWTMLTTEPEIMDTQELEEMAEI